LAGKRQKDPRTLADRRPSRRGDVLVLPAQARVRTPACPRRQDGTQLTSLARSRWADIWASSASAAWDRRGDLVALTRYIITLDLWLQVDGVVRRAPLVRGSQEQPRANPLFVQRGLLGTEMSRMEERFGLTVIDRIRLGMLGDEVAPPRPSPRELRLEAYQGDFEVPEGWEVADD
jgi:hypothetical protein